MDPQYLRPDGHGTGYVLTPLGAIVQGPWEYDPSLSGGNMSIFCNDSLLLSKKIDYSPVQIQLVFQLFQGGVLKYWYKSDYSRAPIDTSYTQNGNMVIKPYKPLPGQIKIMYSTGEWKMNASDSSIHIKLRDSINGPLLFEGKYTNLSADYLALRETIKYDSVINGKTTFCRKVQTFTFTHPWLDPPF